MDDPVQEALKLADELLFEGKDVRPIIEAVCRTLDARLALSKALAESKKSA